MKASYQGAYQFKYQYPVFSGQHKSIKREYSLMYGCISVNNVTANVTVFNATIYIEDSDNICVCCE